jgi:hypothetical protein
LTRNTSVLAINCHCSFFTRLEWRKSGFVYVVKGRMVMSFEDISVYISLFEIQMFG